MITHENLEKSIVFPTVNANNNQAIIDYIQDYPNTEKLDSWLILRLRE